MKKDDLKIKVLGIGGGGQHTVDYLNENNKSKNVEFIVINSDEQILSLTKTEAKYLLCDGDGNALGCGGNSDIGKRLAQIHLDTIRGFVEDADAVFLISGFGGGTGTGVTPVIAKMLKDAGIDTYAIITTPFDFEGVRRITLAENGIDELEPFVNDGLIIDSQSVLRQIKGQTSLKTAFDYVDKKISKEFDKMLSNLGIENK